MNPTAVEPATDWRCLENLWYCGKTTVGREKSLRHALSRIGVETFLPVTQAHRKRHKENSDQLAYYTAKSALFPGYLFARLGESEWTRVKLQLGLSLKPQWVNFGNGPVVIPDDWIQQLRAGQALPVEQGPEYPQLTAGQRVNVFDGPFALRSGTYDGLSGNERVFILMSALGSLRRVEVERRYIEAVA